MKPEDDEITALRLASFKHITQPLDYELLHEQEAGPNMLGLSIIVACAAVLAAVLIVVVL